MSEQRASENSTAEKKIIKLWLTERLLLYCADGRNTFWVCKKSWTVWTNVQRVQSPEMINITGEWNKQLLKGEEIAVKSPSEGS